MAWAPLLVLLMLVALVGIAALHARRVRSGEDFALAGRGLGAGVLVGTLVATWVGTGSILGNAEFTYETGVAGFLLPASGLAGILLLARLAPRLRRYEVATVPEVLGQAFGPAARRLGAVALVGAYLVIVSYQYRAGAAVAERLFPGLAWPPWVWSSAVAVFVMLFTGLAGLWSVAWTDLAAGLVILCGVVGSLVWLGAFGTLEALPAGHLDPGGGLGTLGWVNVLLPGFLLILGDANLMQRFLAAKDPATARRAALGAFVGLAVVESAVIGLALLGRAALGPDLANPAHVILETSFRLVPAVLGLGLVAAVVAVVLSTADSYLLASSTSLTEDLLPRGARPPGAGRHRVLVVVLGLAALGLSFTSDAFFSVALYAYTLYGVTITPAFLAALLAPRLPRGAVTGGMAAGLAVALAWKAAEARGLFGEGSPLDPVLPALGANVLVLVILAGVVRLRGRAAG